MEASRPALQVGREALETSKHQILNAMNGLRNIDFY
jgi:hypothetical protein